MLDERTSTSFGGHPWAPRGKGAASPLLTIAQVAERLAVLPTTLMAWIKAGRVNVVRLGNGFSMIRIHPDELEKLMRHGPNVTSTAAQRKRLSMVSDASLRKRILEELALRPDGMTRTELNKLFCGNVTALQILTAVVELMQEGEVLQFDSIGPSGRQRVTRWRGRAPEPRLGESESESKGDSAVSA